MNSSAMPMVGHYDLALVALSIAIAVLASYTAFDLAGRVTAAQGRKRRFWLASGAIAMGSGIWSMHYIGMLAFSLPVPVVYDVLTVVLSLLAAVFASAIALFVVSFPSMRTLHVLVGGSIMGLGITAMHYTGMAAMRLQAETHYDPFLVAASVAIAIGVSFVGLLLLFRFRERTTTWNWPKLGSVVVMGLAIPSMHYTAMAASSFVAADVLADMRYAMDVSVLGALGITLGTAMLLGLFLTIPRHRVSYAWLPALTVFMVLAALAIGGITFYYVESYLVASTGEALALAAADIADKLDRILYDRYGDIEMLAQAPIMQGRNQAAKSKYLASMKETYRYYLWLGVTDSNGRIVASSNPASDGEDRSQMAWFKDVRDRGGIHVRDAQTFQDSGGIMAVAFTAPIYGTRGEFLGVVTARVGLPVLEDVIAGTVGALQIQRGKKVPIEYQFLNRDGDVIADSILHQEAGNDLVNLKLLALPSALLSASAQPGYIEEIHKRRQVPVVSGYASTSGYGQFTGLHWAVLVRMDRKDVLAPIQEVLWKLGMAAAVVFVPMLGALIWSTRHLRREWAVAQQEAARAMTAESHSRLIIDTALDAVIVMDSDGLIKDWNPQAEKAFGWSRAEALGRLLSETIIPPQYRDAHNRGLKRFLATGEGPVLNKRIELTALHRDGHEFSVELTISPLRTGEAVTFSAFIRDITERKRAEAEMQKAKEAAEIANQAKSEFLASMSHEIRTPMNAIIGMADLLAETPLNDDQQKYVQIFRRAGDNLLSLINDILDLSKVEASQLELERTGFDLNELVEKVTEMLAVRAHEKFLELACYIAPEVPPYLVGDSTRLRQVLVNLLGNSIKFTDSGEVVLRVERDESIPSSAGESVALRFAISDTGIGIPPDKLGMIFERFTQVDSSTTRKHGGTGLGLAICKRLVELMGGRIWAKSSPGLGTTFYFTVCFEVQPATQRSRKFTPVQLQGLRTLVVDDNDTNRLILRELLSSWKAVVTEAETGTAALAELQRAQAAGAPYELLLLDCRMPEMDGFQVAEAIRAHPGLTGVTMMMLTSDNRKDHIQRSRDLGLAGYVVKPIRRTDLLEAVATAVGQNRSAVSPAPAEVPPAPAPAEDQRALRILLAEDSSDNRLLIQSYFKKTLHHLDIADNGVIAVAKFRARNYDLVLMDMQMPVKDGYAATRAIRQWERDHGRPPTPIIALTAHALKGDEEKTLAAGCTAHLAKPIKKAVLLQAIQEYTMSVTK